jgi:hypothetical protein
LSFRSGQKLKEGFIRIKAINRGQLPFQNFLINLTLEIESINEKEETEKTEDQNSFTEADAQSKGIRKSL